MTLSNGIYFGIPFEEYDALNRLSKTRLKQILVSPADFWADSWLNPNPQRLTPEQERRRKIALLLGKAYHCARLEPDDFHNRYVREISQADFAEVEGFLATGKDMGAKLEELGLKKSGSVSEQARRLRDEGDISSDLIWQLQLETWDNDRGDRIALPAEAFDQIIIDMDRLASVPSVHAALSEGCAEVSIIYDCPETGLPMKARLDWLRADGWAEFKSFANPNGKPVEQCILDAIRFNRYYIDVAAYHEAVEAIRLDDLPVICHRAEPPTPEQAEADRAMLLMVDALKAHAGPLPHKLIFQQKGGVPNVLSRELRLFENPYRAVEELRSDNATADRIERAEKFAAMATVQPTMLMMKARAEIKRAKRTFIGYCEIYAPGEPWLPFEPHAEISDLDFHPNWLETI